MAYDSAVVTFTTKTNKVDLVDAAHINLVQAEIVTIETILGAGVKGDRVNVKTRLNNMLDADGSILSGTVFPSPSYPSQAFYKTDVDILYIMNAANSAWGAQNISQIFTYNTAFTASQAYLLTSLDTTRTFTPNTPLRGITEILKEITLPANQSGTVLAMATFTASGDDTPAYGIQGANGATGSTAGSSSGPTHLETVITVVGSSKIQCYARYATGTGGDTITVSNFRIYYHKMEASTVTTPTASLDADITG